jgi:hypothetical protein
MNFELVYNHASPHEKGFFRSVASWLWQKYKDTTGVDNVHWRRDHNNYVSSRFDDDMKKALDKCGVSREDIYGAWRIWAIDTPYGSDYCVVLVCWLNRENFICKRRVFVHIPDSDDVIAVELKLIASSL